MRRIRWFYILITLTLLLASCQPGEVSVSLEGPMALLATESSEVVALAGAPTPEANGDTQPVIDECLSCHSDKDRLIETADPVEEIAESESKGVG